MRRDSVRSTTPSAAGDPTPRPPPCLLEVLDTSFPATDARIGHTQPALPSVACARMARYAASSSASSSSIFQQRRGPPSSALTHDVSLCDSLIEAIAGAMPPTCDNGTPVHPDQDTVCPSTASSRDTPPTREPTTPVQHEVQRQAHFLEGRVGVGE